MGTQRFLGDQYLASLNATVSSMTLPGLAFSPYPWLTRWVNYGSLFSRPRFCFKDALPTFIIFVALNVNHSETILSHGVTSQWTLGELIPVSLAPKFS